MTGQACPTCGSEDPQIPRQGFWATDSQGYPHFGLCPDAYHDEHKEPSGDTSHSCAGPDSGRPGGSTSKPTPEPAADADHVGAAPMFQSNHYGRCMPLASVLSGLASQEGCDGEEYDAMVAAADWINKAVVAAHAGAVGRADLQEVLWGVMFDKGSRKCTTNDIALMTDAALAWMSGKTLAAQPEACPDCPPDPGPCRICGRRVTASTPPCEARRSRAMGSETKPCRAWAVMDDEGRMNGYRSLANNSPHVHVRLYRTRAGARAAKRSWERIARVEIREVSDG